MAGRYDQWRRLRGDTDRPDLIDVGKKLLGYLDEQRRLSGVPTLAIERKLPDGSIVRARFDGEIPCIEVLSGESGKQALPAFIEGFIARPSPASDQYANTDKNHVLLRPGTGGWAPYFFDDAHRPASMAPAPLYGRLFPDGIGRYGNVDWRNADQSVVLSWMGPSARYYGNAPNSYATDPYVFYRGRVLFDMATHLAETDGIGHVLAGVKGACLRSVAKGQSWLYVVLRSNGVSPNYLVRLPITSPAEKKKLAAHLSEPPHLYIDAEIASDAVGEVLLVFPTLATFDAYHPWCFNTAGTEARRICNLSGVSNEQRIWEDEEGWHYENSTTAYTSITNARDMTRQFVSPGNYHIRLEHQSPPALPNTAPDFTAEYTHDYSFDYVSGTGLIDAHAVLVNSQVEKAHSTSHPTVPIAVDFWDGAWRYAEEYLANGSATRSLECTPDITMDVVVLEVDETITTQSESIVGSVLFELTESSSAVADGLKTDFLDLQMGSSYTTFSSYTNTFRREHVLGSIEANADEQIEFSGSTVSSESSIGVRYLDLRFGIAVFETKTVAGTLRREGSKSIEYLGGISPGPDRTVTLTRDYVGDTTYVSRIFVNGEEVYTDPKVVDDSFTSSDGLGTSVQAFLDWFIGDFVYHAFGYVEPWTLTDAYADSCAFITTIGGSATEDYAGGEWQVPYGKNDGSLVDTPSALVDGTTPVTASLPFGFNLNAASSGPSMEWRDMLDSNFYLYGSWVSKGSAWIVAQENGPNRGTSTPARNTASSHAGLTGLLAETGQDRLNPVGYLSKTIIAVER